MSPFTSFKNLFKAAATNKSNDHNDNMQVEPQPDRKLKQFLRSISEPLLANLSHKTQKAKSETTQSKPAAEEEQRADSVTSALSRDDYDEDDPDFNDWVRRNRWPVHPWPVVNRSPSASASSRPNIETNPSASGPPPTAPFRASLGRSVYAISKDPAAWHERNERELAQYFEMNGANTRYKRRLLLYMLGGPASMKSAAWLHAHPSDLWNTSAEESANFSDQYSDLTLEGIVETYERTGFYDHPLQSWVGDVSDLADRSEIVGMTQAIQERSFGAKWIEGDGAFDKKGSASAVV